MSKQTTDKINKEPCTIWEEAYQYYLNKYYNLFMSNYEADGISLQQFDYLMRKFWADGKASAFIIKNTNEICFTPFTTQTFNNYDYPVTINLIDSRGVGFIPTTPQVVGETCVIGYAQRNKKPILTMVNYLIEKICDVEILINIAEDTLKLPFLIICNDSDKERMQTLINSLIAGKSKLFGSVADFDNIKTLVNNNPYILDKLYSFKLERENELKTYLGIDNSAQNKTQYVNIDDVNSNNDEIAQSNTTFLDNFKAFCDDVREVLGYNMAIKLKHSKTLKNNENEESDEEDEAYENY